MTQSVAPGWTPGVRGIGLASLLADLGYEIPTSLLPAFLASVLGAPAAALGLIEGIADGLAGLARFGGGPLADDPARRRSLAVGGYTATAVLSALIGLATAVWQVAILRAGSWAARGLRVPARNALLADAVERGSYGRAYGFERAMDNLGAVGGPILALLLVAAVGVREAILLSVIPGLLAAAAIVYAIRHLERPRERWTADSVRGPAAPSRVARSAARRGQPVRGGQRRRDAPHPAGERAVQRLRRASTARRRWRSGSTSRTTSRRPLPRSWPAAWPISVDHSLSSPVGIALFGVAYVAFAVAGPTMGPLAAAFVAAGVGIGAVETAEHAAVASLAPTDLRGSAFGLLAGVQSLGDLVASAIVGFLWTLISPVVEFLFAAGLMVASLLALTLSRVGPDR